MRVGNGHSTHMLAFASPEQATPDRSIDVEAAQAVIVADRKAREDAVRSELEAMLSRHNCLLRPELTISPDGVTVATVRVVAK